MKKSTICQILGDLSLWNPPVNPSTPGMAIRRLSFIRPAAVTRPFCYQGEVTRVF